MIDDYLVGQKIVGVTTNKQLNEPDAEVPVHNHTYFSFQYPNCRLGPLAINARSILEVISSSLGTLVVQYSDSSQNTFLLLSTMYSRHDRLLHYPIRAPPSTTTTRLPHLSAHLVQHGLDASTIDACRLQVDQHQMVVSTVGHHLRIKQEAPQISEVSSFLCGW